MQSGFTRTGELQHHVILHGSDMYVVIQHLPAFPLFVCRNALRTCYVAPQHAPVIKQPLGHPAGALQPPTPAAPALTTLHA